MPVISLKRCPTCGVSRPLEDFPRDKSKASGRATKCRECDNARSRRYYEANRDRVIARVVAKQVRRVRRCARCGEPATSQRHHYCDRCRTEAHAEQRRRDNRRGRVRRPLASSSARGYGTAHQRERRRVARIVEAGRARCARCGRPIIPGTPWDLGHDDLDRSKYSGPEHRACNRASAKHRKQIEKAFGVPVTVLRSRL